MAKGKKSHLSRKNLAKVFQAPKGESTEGTITGWSKTNKFPRGAVRCGMLDPDMNCRDYGGGSIYVKDPEGTSGLPSRTFQPYKY